MIRHPVFKLGLLGGLCFLLGFSYNYHLPKIEAVLLTELERLSEKHSPVRIWAQELHLNLFPLGVSLNNVRLLPQAPVDRYLAPTVLKEVGANLAVWPLLRGELRLAQVFVRDSEFNIFLRPELFAADKRGRTKPHVDFEALYRLPIDEIVLDNVRLQGRLEPQSVVFRVEQMNLTVENRYRSLFIDLIAPGVSVKPSGPAAPLQGGLELRSLVEAREIQVSAFKLKADESFVVASGHLSGDIAGGHIDQGAFDARAKLRLPDLNTWEKVFFARPRIPRVEGRAELDVAVNLRPGQITQIESDVSSRGLQIDKFKVGEIKGHVSSNLNTLTAQKIMIRGTSGRLELRKINVDLEPTARTFTTDVVVNNEVKQFLEDISVKNVPLLIPLKGEGTCHGTWADKPSATCHAKMSASRAWIHADDKPATTIVDIHDLRAEGDVQVSEHDVVFKADLEVGKTSHGFSHGSVDFEDGFKIFYSGERVDFADVKNLANLKLEGVTKLEGSTKGTAKWATIDLNAEARDFWLENYPLGRFNGKVSYKAGLLAFNKMQGQLGTTQYNGSVAIDLRQKQIKLGLQIPFADLRDVQGMFGRKVKLPIDFTGTGQGQIEAHGPLHFPDMSYHVRSSFYRGEIANESYDEFIFNVTSRDGLVQSDRIALLKSAGGAEAKGTITPVGVIDATVVGHGLRLEQSENINHLGLDLQGLADFTAQIKGQLPRPQIELNGKLSRMVLADVAAQDSTFRMNILSDRLEASGSFLGTTLMSEITWPFTVDAPFALKLRARKWDFTNVFQLVSKSARQMDFATSVSGNVNLASPRGGFWNSTGQMVLNEFTLRKGAKSLAATKPMILNMHQGEINSSNFGISSSDSYLKFDAAGLKRDKINASLNGKLDLSLLGLFTPFLADLRGNLALSMDLSGSVDKPRFSGSAYIDKGYAKLADFVHPFSNMRADLMFNDNQIVLNSVQGELGGGKISGDGRITIAGHAHPVDVKASFSDVKLNFPENFRTQGGGTVAITGNAFPYTLGIVYNVTGGDISYEIGETSGGTANVKASAYLPHFLAQESFHAFLFNIDVALKNPVTISNSLALAQLNGRIGINGTPDRLLLNGTVTPSPGGKVYFKDQAFEIGSAFVEYTNNIPSEPKIFLTANTHVTEFAQNDAGKASNTVERTYDINLLVQGRGPNPQILLTSQPPLPQPDIVSLLALGVTTGGGYGLDTKNGAVSSDAQATASSSAAIGATLLQKAGGKKLKESLGVDVKVSSTQSTPDLASYPKVTLSKQWTPTFGASASSTLQANPSNDVKVEYKVNKNVSVVGSWNGREQNYLQEQNDTSTQSVFGLDLEYKMNFK